MTSLSLYTKIETLPPALKAEAMDFIDYLMTKSKQKKEPSKKQKSGTREFGSLKGKIQLSKDFDDPLELFNDYM